MRDEGRTTITGFEIDSVWVDECAAVDDDVWRKLIEDGKLQAAMKRTIDDRGASVFRDLYMQHAHSTDWTHVDWHTQMPVAPKPHPDRPLTPSAGDW
jgi:hypothetical protein